MPRALLLLVLAFPAQAQVCSESELTPGCVAAPAAQPAADKGFLAGTADCPADWQAKRKGDCLVPGRFRDEGKDYVHPRGWVIERRCFNDARFTARELVDAVEAAWKRMDPKTSVAKGGCLSKFNPEWGAELVGKVWDRSFYISCGAPDTAKFCAQTFEETRPQRELIVLRDVKGCMGPETTGLAGTIFHESLHAAGADNLSTVQHNEAWKLEQYKFVQDRVYGTEALCFFGTAKSRKRRNLVNLSQCVRAAEYNTFHGREELCQQFPASYSQTPAGFFKHGGS